MPRVVYKTSFYKIVKPSLENVTICKVNWRHRFWRVLALEEFTDVQCVIVDRPMPSLAGYRIIEGSSAFNSASDSRFPSITPSGFAKTFIDQRQLGIRKSIGGVYDEGCNLVLKRTVGFEKRVTLWRSLSRQEESPTLAISRIESITSGFVPRSSRKFRGKRSDL